MRFDMKWLPFAQRQAQRQQVVTMPYQHGIVEAAKDVTLRASIERIARKAEIMALDATRGTPARQDAEEVRLLAGIALRCIGGENA